MSCNAQVVRGKMAKIAQHILAKECMTENVIEDIVTCYIPMQQVWYGLYEAIANLSTCKLKGRFRTFKSSHFISIPIVMEIAIMTADFLGAVEKEEDEAFYPPKEDDKMPAIITPNEIRQGLHVKVSKGRTEGEVSIAIGELSFLDHKILLRIDILDSDVLVDDSQIVLAEFRWI